MELDREQSGSARAAREIPMVCSCARELNPNWTLDIGADDLCVYVQEKHCMPFNVSGNPLPG